MQMNHESKNWRIYYVNELYEGDLGMFPGTFKEMTVFGLKIQWQNLGDTTYLHKILVFRNSFLPPKSPPLPKFHWLYSLWDLHETLSLVISHFLPLVISIFHSSTYSITLCLWSSQELCSVPFLLWRTHLWVSFSLSGFLHESPKWGWLTLTFYCYLAFYPPPWCATYVSKLGQ